MTTYAFYKQSAAMPDVQPGKVAFKKTINIPDLIANGGLATTAGVATALPSTGFGAADVLQVFNIPEGFLVKSGGIVVTTAEGATCTVDVGVTTAAQIHTATADTDGILDGVDLNATGATITGVSQGIGANNLMGYLFVDDGTVDILFNNAGTDTAVFDIWLEGVMTK